VRTVSTIRSYTIGSSAQRTNVFVATPSTTSRSRTSLVRWQVMVSSGPDNPITASASGIERPSDGLIGRGLAPLMGTGSRSKPPSPPRAAVDKQRDQPPPQGYDRVSVPDLPASSSAVAVAWRKPCGSRAGRHQQLVAQRRIDMLGRSSAIPGAARRECRQQPRHRMATESSPGRRVRESTVLPGSLPSPPDSRR